MFSRFGSRVVVQKETRREGTHPDLLRVASLSPAHLRVPPAPNPKTQFSQGLTKFGTTDKTTPKDLQLHTSQAFHIKRFKSQRATVKVHIARRELRRKPNSHRPFINRALTTFRYI